MGIAQKRTELRSAAFDHSDPHGDEDRADVLSVLELMDTPLKRIQQNTWRKDKYPNGINTETMGLSKLSCNPKDSFSLESATLKIVNVRVSTG